MIQRWIQTWKLLALTFPDQIHPGLLHRPHRNRATDELFDLLAKAYEEPPRAHHTMQTHLKECFAFYDTLPHLSGKSARTEMAIWFHDSVYSMEPGFNNEEESAKWCKYLLMDVGVFEGLATQISNLILADHNAVLVDPEQQVLADVDLWILAAPPNRFKLYDEVQIRNEYRAVPDEVFYPARTRIMKRFAEKEHIYYTPQIRELLEDRAKANLAKYL